MDFSDLEISESVRDLDANGFIEVSGRVRYAFPDINTILLADETGFIILRVPDYFSGVNFSPGYRCIAIGYPVEEDSGVVSFVGERVLLETGNVKMDSFSPGFLPFSIVSYFGWFSSELNTVTDDDGVWIEETLYQKRPWWDDKRLTSIHRIDFVYDWELEQGELPKYINECISNTEDLDTSERTSN